MFGFININKPAGITSHDAVSKLRRISGFKKIGHAGTLDPCASGVLPIAFGKAAKLIDYLPSDKRYTAELEFGKCSDTCDLEGNIELLNSKPVNLQMIKEVLPLFTGRITQIPPAYSAVHYKGRRLYELARKGIIPDDIPPRIVNVYKNEIICFDEEKQMLKLDIFCSKGTYIRSIISGLGAALNSGAVMTALVRTQGCGMNLDDALILDEHLAKEDIEKHLINPSDIAAIRTYEISDGEYKRIINGNSIKNRFNIQDEKALLSYHGILAALVSADDNIIQPDKLLQI